VGTVTNWISGLTSSSAHRVGLEPRNVRFLLENRAARVLPCLPAKKGCESLYCWAVRRVLPSSLPRRAVAVHGLSHSQILMQDPRCLAVGRPSYYIFLHYPRRRLPCWSIVWSQRLMGVGTLSSDCGVLSGGAALVSQADRVLSGRGADRMIRFPVGQRSGSHHHVPKDSLPSEGSAFGHPQSWSIVLVLFRHRHTRHWVVPS
jgi:hypothetical protein